MEEVSEPESARRKTGRSSLREELLAEVAVLSSELEAARRSLGRSPGLSFDERFGESLAEWSVEPLVMGREVSSIACDAAACSSMVPSLTIVTLVAWYTL